MSDMVIVVIMLFLGTLLGAYIATKNYQSDHGVIPDRQPGLKHTIYEEK